VGRRKGPPGPDGFVVIDKPVGPTSFGVMRAAQRALGARKAGHAGTLDPAATGVLIVLLGEGTKLSQWVIGHDKAYRATIALGSITDTLDAEGEVLESAPVLEAHTDETAVRAALETLVGPQEQIPPAYSAIKVDGRSLMSRARAGEAVAPKPRSVVCRSLSLVSIENNHIVVDVECGKGYYVRSLARDLGAALGIPAHLHALRRTRSGGFSVEEAVPLEGLSREAIRPFADVAFDIEKIRLSDVEATAIRHGRPVPAKADAPDRAILCDDTGRPLAMAERLDTIWKVVRGFKQPEQPTLSTP
jgi:tRNA pseudouridine55 synthase